MKWIFCLFGLVPSISHAYEILPEYQHYSKDEQRDINGPYLIGSEYLSDQLTYQLPLDWHLDFLKNKKVFQYAAGSLNGTRFMTQNRVKLHGALLENLDFKLSYLDQAELDQARKSFNLEFDFKLTDWLSLSLYGEPSTIKSEDNMGGAIKFHFSVDHYFRLFYTLVHFSHNERHESDDRYLESPRSYGFVWRRLLPETKEYMEAVFRRDQKLVHVFPASGREYSYENNYAHLRGRHLIDSQYAFLQWELVGKQGFEADNLNPSNPQPVTRWDTKKLSTLIQYKNEMSWLDTLGLRYSYQQWNSNQGHVIHNNFLPHLWVPFYRGDQGKLMHNWRAGYEFTWHRGQGKESLRSLDDKNDFLEHRFNIRYEMIFSQSARFFLLFTFDLDEFGSGSTWEGGSAKFHWTF